MFRLGQFCWSPLDHERGELEDTTPQKDIQHPKAQSVDYFLFMSLFISILEIYID